MKIKTQKDLIKLGEKLANNPNFTASTIHRNQTALNPVLKKGGVHDKDNPKFRHKKQRKAAKLSLQKLY